MAKGHNIECNACGEVLYGRKGIEFISKDHLALKGSFTVQRVDETGQPDFFYVTERPDEMHHFCDLNCLNDLLNFRKDRHEQKKRVERIQEARRETNI